QWSGTATDTAYGRHVQRPRAATAWRAGRQRPNVLGNRAEWKATRPVEAASAASPTRSRWRQALYLSDQLGDGAASGRQPNLRMETNGKARAEHIPGH